MIDHPVATMTGYTLESVATIRLHLEIVDPTEGELADQTGLRFGWDWRWIDKSVFEVAITLDLAPTAEREEVAGLTLVGRFKVHGTPAQVAPEQFAYGHAPAILFPFARQALASASLQSPYGTLMLPPLNIVQMMSEFDLTKTQAAMQQQSA